MLTTLLALTTTTNNAKARHFDQILIDNAAMLVGTKDSFTTVKGMVCWHPARRRPLFVLASRLSEAERESTLLDLHTVLQHYGQGNNAVFKVISNGGAVKDALAA